MSSTPSSGNGKNPHHSGDEAMIPESLFFEFLNRMPATSDSLAWISSFRESLHLLFPEISRISVNVNLNCNLQPLSLRKVYDPILEQITEEHTTTADADLQATEPRPSPSQILLDGFRAQGHPLDQFHEPVAVDYYIENTAYVGSIFLWVARSEEPLAISTIERFRRLDPFIRFAMSDLVARTQTTHPTVDAFNGAVDNMARDADLGRQERRVAMQLVYGFSEQAIADRLSITLETVREHIQEIYRKTGTSSILELGAKYFTPRADS